MRTVIPSMCWPLREGKRKPPCVVSRAVVLRCQGLPWLAARVNLPSKHALARRTEFSCRSHPPTFRLVSPADTGRFDVHVLVPLLFEYEGMLLWPTFETPIFEAAVHAVFDYMCSVAAHHRVSSLWCPDLRNSICDLVAKRGLRVEVDEDPEAGLLTGTIHVSYGYGEVPLRRGRVTFVARQMDA
jgi:hypothetical protein